MDELKSRARRAGLLYLLLATISPITDLYIPGLFIVSGDATATARNITAGMLTYRLGILGGLASSTVMLLVALSLYNLLKDVDKKLARLMLALVLVGVAVAIVNLLNQLAPVILLGDPYFLSVFTQPQLDALALVFLRLRSGGVQVATVFWGLWLLPFGLLVIKSGFLPKVLGILLIAGCFAYLVLSVTSLAFPAWSELVSRFTLPFGAVGELAMIVFLLVKGISRPGPEVRIPL